MARAPYDPVKAHEYYERTKELTGRKEGTSKGLPTPRSPAKAAAAREKVTRLKANVSKLNKALAEAQAALSKSRQNARKTAKANSDGKTTVQERKSSKEYRDKNQTKLQAKAKKTAKSSGGSSQASKSSSKSVSDMSAQDLRARIIKIKSALRDAKRQLSAASQELGQLAHSAIASDPNVNEHFARFQSERMPLR